MIDYNDRVSRKQRYEASIDWEMSKKPDIVHIMCINPQGSGKDLLINADIYERYFTGKSIFDSVITGCLNRPFYKGEAKNIFANCKLNKEVYSDDYSRIDSLQDFRDAVDGIVYVTDAQKWFNSRGMDMVKPSPEMIDLCANSRKDGNTMLFSDHRYKNIDIKIRVLFGLVVFPEQNLLNDEIVKLKNYSVLYLVRDDVGKRLVRDELVDLPRYAGLYDTEEKAVALKRF